MSSPWRDVSMQEMHLCPQCRGPRISLLDAQSFKPEFHLWIMEAYCPDCQQVIAGEVSVYQLSALADAVEDSFASMLEAANRLRRDGFVENWPPGPPLG